jgi:hypothetical protein
MQSNTNWRNDIEYSKTGEIIKEIDELIGTNNNDETKIKLEKLIVNNSWNDKNERLIASIGENAVSYKWLHEKSATFYTSINVILNIVVIVFSTGLSAQTFFPEESNSALEISKRIFIYITNVLTVVMNYLKFSEMASSHSEIANKFSELYHDIQQQLCMYRKDRYLATKYIQETFKKYDSLVVSGPDLSPYIINKFKTTFKNSNVSMPDIADRLQKIEIITENKNDSNPNIDLSQVSSNVNMTNNLKNMTKINSLCIEGDITDEDLKKINMDDIDNLKTKGLLAKMNWENQRYTNFK